MPKMPSTTATKLRMDVMAMIGVGDRLTIKSLEWHCVEAGVLTGARWASQSTLRRTLNQAVELGLLTRRPGVNYNGGDVWRPWPVRPMINIGEDRLPTLWKLSVPRMREEIATMGRGQGPADCQTVFGYGAVESYFGVAETIVVQLERLLAAKGRHWERYRWSLRVRRIEWGCRLEAARGALTEA